MATDPYRDFFENPTVTRQKHYEILRARFVEKRRIKDIAQSFAMSPFTVQALVRDFKANVDQGEGPSFFLRAKTGPKGERKKPQVREHVLRLRAKRYSDQDIHKALKLAGFDVSLALVDQVLREQGLRAMGKRTKEEREEVARQIRSGEIPGLTVPGPAAPKTPAVAATCAPSSLARHATSTAAWPACSCSRPFWRKCNWTKSRRRPAWPAQK